jgi:hypothetical protein
MRLIQIACKDPMLISPPAPFCSTQEAVALVSAAQSALSPPRGQSVPISRDPGVREVAQRVWDDDQPGHEAPGEREPGENPKDGVRTCDEGTAGDQGDTAEGVRDHADSGKEAPGGVRLAGHEPKRALGVILQDEANPGATEVAFPVEDDHRGL